MVVTSLDKVPFKSLIDCFLKAFEGYYVKMPSSPDYYQSRWKAAIVRYDLSYGIVDKDQMVGFIVHGIDRRDGDFIAFNTGTGVIPEYRGKRIIERIYAEALPELRKTGITKSRLEVIRENQPALRLYSKLGFDITRRYKCYQGTIKPLAPPAVLKEVLENEIQWSGLPNQQFQSWDHHPNSLKLGNYKFYQAWHGKNPLGLLVVNDGLNYLAQCEVYTDLGPNWDKLFSALHELTPTLKINNVDERLTGKIAAIERSGLKNSVDQFEMEWVLNQ